MSAFTTGFATAFLVRAFASFSGRPLTARATDTSPLITALAPCFKVCLAVLLATLATDSTALPGMRFVGSRRMSPARPATNAAPEPSSMSAPEPLAPMVPMVFRTSCVKTVGLPLTEFSKFSAPAWKRLARFTSPVFAWRAFSFRKPVRPASGADTAPSSA